MKIYMHAKCHKIRFNLQYNFILQQEEYKNSIFVFFITIEFFIASLPITMTLSFMSEKEGLERRDKYAFGSWSWSNG